MYRRQKHPFLSPPAIMVPTELFHQMMQDILRDPVLGSLPFYDQKKVVALLDQLPMMPDSHRVVWDPVLMSVLSACVIQDRFGLGTKTAGKDAFAIGSHPVDGDLAVPDLHHMPLEARLRNSLPVSPITHITRN